MSILSMSQALALGIESIEARADIPPKTKECAVKLLRSLERSDWHRSWTKEGVIRALRYYRERTGRAPTVADLKEHGMPNGVTVQALFQMKPSLLLKRLFPENHALGCVKPEPSNRFGFESENDWLNCFAVQFDLHKDEGMCCRQYNSLRDKGTPAWETIARHCKLPTWTALMKKAGVKYARKIENAGELSVNRVKSPFIDLLDAVNREHERLNREYLEMLERHEKTHRQS